jgi:hypothetical protein
MAATPRVLEHLGPYIDHPPVRAFCDISARCYQRYNEIADRRDRSKESGRQHAVIRMMYIAEATSTVIRLSASWALSLPAMSLTRDRYEQAVRFSWLARQPDHLEWVKYLASYHAKTNKLYRSLKPKHRAELDKMGWRPEPWMTEMPTKEQRAYLEQWNSMSLVEMATKRDAMLHLRDTRLDKATLADLYLPIYAQFSSVTHYDFFGLKMLEFHEAPDRQVVLAPDPHWPAMLCLQNALFDLMQCREAVVAYFASDDPTFGELYEEWHACLDRMGINPTKQTTT